MSIKPLLGVVDGCIDLSGQEGTGGCSALRAGEQACGCLALRGGEQGLGGNDCWFASGRRSRRRRLLMSFTEGDLETDRSMSNGKEGKERSLKASITSNNHGAQAAKPAPPYHSKNNNHLTSPTSQSIYQSCHPPPTHHQPQPTKNNAIRTLPHPPLPRHIPRPPLPHPPPLGLRHPQRRKNLGLVDCCVGACPPRPGHVLQVTSAHGSDAKS